jgi:glycosyltransferase involved in cell wall biosynthesis
MDHRERQPLIISYIGRLEYEKGIDIVLSTIDVLFADSRDAYIFHIIGDGRYLKECQEVAKRYPREVYVHGHLGTTQKDTILQKSDILLMPSRFLETFGMTALEGVSSGVRVI